MRFGMLLAGLLSFGCGALTPPRLDAGTGGAGETGGGTAVGATGGGAGGGGAAGSDGGFTFVTVTVHSPSMSSEVQGISGTPGDVWAIQSTGDLLHSTGGAFEFVATLTGSLTRASVFARNGAVVVAGSAGLFTCMSSCTGRTSFTSYSMGVGNGNDRPAALCGRSATQVYAVTNDDFTENVVLYRWNGTVWANDAALPLKRGNACEVTADGTLFIAGQGGVLRYANGGSTLEPLPGSMTDAWYGIAAVGDEVQACGTQHRVARRSAAGGWSIVNSPMGATEALMGIAGLDPQTFFAGGVVSSQEPSLWYRFDGARWTAPTQDLPGFPSGHGVIRFVNEVSPDEVYFVGNFTFAPSIVRGTR